MAMTKEQKVHYLDQIRKGATYDGGSEDREMIAAGLVENINGKLEKTAAGTDFYRHEMEKYNRGLF